MSKLITCLKYDALATMACVKDLLDAGSNKVVALYKEQFQTDKKSRVAKRAQSDFNKLNCYLSKERYDSKVQYYLESDQEKRDWRRLICYSVRISGEPIHNEKDVLKYKLDIRDRHKAIHFLKAKEDLMSAAYKVLSEAPQINVSAAVSGSDRSLFEKVKILDEFEITSHTKDLIDYVEVRTGVERKDKVLTNNSLPTSVEDKFNPFSLSAVGIGPRIYFTQTSKEKYDIRLTVFEADTEGSYKLKSDMILFKSYMTAPELIFEYEQRGLDGVRYIYEEKRCGREDRMFASDENDSGVSFSV